MIKTLKKLSPLIGAMALSFALCGCGEEKADMSKDVAPTLTATPVVTEAPEEPPKYTETNPVFSVPSGFYKDEFRLEMGCADEKAKIYYTTDGTAPDSSSKLYTSPILLKNATDNNNVLSMQGGAAPGGDYFPDYNITKANVIRAVAYLSDGTVSEISNGTFFVGVDRQENFGDAPVISMFTDPDNLFGYEKGIYIKGKSYDDWIAADSRNKNKQGWEQFGNFSQKGREWEREAIIEYIGSNEGETFTAGVGIRIMGAASRRNMQKSFRLVCREEYGTKSVEYELVPDNERSDGRGVVRSYKTFLLRNGGNDCDYTKFRDPLLQDLVSARDMETQQSTPAVLFIDGEYWGMYALTEDYSEHYIEQNYGIDNNNIIIIKRGGIEGGNEEDIELYSEMKKFIVESDMRDEDNYKKACELLDITSFAEYCAFNIYIDNKDSFFKDNNWSMWRVRDTFPDIEKADGKWRMMVYDTEYSTGLYGDGNDYTSNSLKDAINGSGTGSKMLKSLLASEEFKRIFINTLCDMKNIDFEERRVNAAVIKWDSLYRGLVPETIKRFGPDWIVRWNDPKDHYNGQVRTLKSWLSGRNFKFLDKVTATMNLEMPVEVKVSVSDGHLGCLNFNTSKVDINSDYTCMYYKECAFTITAKPAEGAEFDHWEITNGEIWDEKDPTAFIMAEEGCEVKAVFTKTEE